MNATIARNSWLVGVLAILGFALPGQTFGTTSFVQVCINAWNDAPASDVCTSSGEVSRIVAGTDMGNCVIPTVSCSVSATELDGAIQTWTLNPSEELNESPSDTATLDVCFTAVEENDVTVGYTAEIDTGCATGEITSEDMSDSELPY